MPGRSENYVASTHLRKLVELGVAKNEIARECGLGRQSVNTWLADGQCPKYAEAAAEGVVLRRGQSAMNLTKPTFLLVTVPANFNDALKAVVDGFGGSITKIDIE